MSKQGKTLAERLAEARADSPINSMTHAQAAHQVTNAAKKGVPTGKVTKGAFKEGNEAWNKDKSGSWGKTRKNRAAEMSEEDRRRYFGVKEEHNPETIEKMSLSASKRWSKHRRPKGVADGVEYENFLVCAEKLGIHKDTVTYRCKTNSKSWEGWYFKDE